MTLRAWLRKALASRWAAITLSLVIALPLFALSMPRLLAEITLVPTRMTLEQLREGVPVSDTELEEAGRALALALRLSPGSGRLRADRAWVLLLQAERAGLGQARARVLLQEARQELEQGLALDPANGFGWTRLALAELALTGAVTPKLAAALDMSYATTPYEANLMLLRAEVAFGFYDELNSTLQARAQDDIAFLWSRSWEDQKALMSYACRSGRAFLLVQSLRGDKDRLAEFDKLYESYLTPEGCASKQR